MGIWENLQMELLLQVIYQLLLFFQVHNAKFISHGFSASIFYVMEFHGVYGKVEYNTYYLHFDEALVE